jgi:D-lactate dehydrogenase
VGPLLAPDPSRIGRPPGDVSPDAAPDWVAGGTPQPLRGDLERLLGADRVLARASDIVRYASDASPYRKLPKVVVMAHDAEDVRKVLDHARRSDERVTFRGGGTSLNGQGQTDGILVDVRRHFAGVEVLDGGARAKVRAGTLLGFANRVLAPTGHKLGPDPASTDIATVGGVVANNSGGMRCGVAWDSYSTVEALTFVTASGALIDTAAPGAEERFAQAEPALAEGLMALRAELLADEELAARIRRKYEIKNVTGYRLDALLDGDTPLEIFRRLLVGSEGTLGFLLDATFRTRPQPAHTTVAWIHTKDVDTAVEMVPALVEAGGRAVELMVAPALITAAWNMVGAPEEWKELPPESAVLLVEFGGADEAELDAYVAKAEEIFAARETIRPIEFTREAEGIELAWRVREGLFGLVGRMRPLGTALIIEDVCVPPARIAEAAHEIMGLLGEHGFLTGVAGHASAGNLHFQLTPDFAKPEDRERYERFIERLVALIVDKYDGSLKAEHGTGINMAPYVEREWGAKATALMWRIKALADPDGILNPGVVLNRDPEVHLRDLKTQPLIEEVAAHCVECGFCEPVCPSRHVTTTPRQRIVLRREMARQPEGSPVYETLVREYEYDAIQTCAADGTCASVCPLAIDTGKMVKAFRARERTPREEAVAARIAQRFAAVERATRTGLRAGRATARVAGDRAVAGAAAAVRRRVSADLVPAWTEPMPPPAPPLPRTERAGATAVYLPACINRIFGGDPLPATLVGLARRAGRPLWIPDDVAGVCCGTPWSSKGFTRGHALMAHRTAEALLRWSDDGALPVVIDASSCSHGVISELPEQLDEALRERFARVRVVDVTQWAAEILLPALTVTRRVRSVAVHPTCSSGHLGVQAALESVLVQLADEVVVPAGTTCCGMAGDRGMLHPELPHSALRDAARSLDGRSFDDHVCSNRTCEIALTRETGRPYRSFVFLLDACTRP